MKKISSIIFILVIFIACQWGIVLAAPKAIFPGTKFNAGEIEQGALITHSFPLKNTGDSPLIVKVNDCGCDGVTFKTPSEPVRPGNSGVITISVPTINHKGAFTRDVTIVTNDPVMKTLRLCITAQVREVLSIEPAYIHFGQVRQGVPQQRELTIANNGREPLIILGMEARPAGMTALYPPTRKLVLNPGEKKMYTLKLAPPTQAGHLQGLLSIRTDRKGLELKQIRVQADVVAE